MQENNLLNVAIVLEESGDTIRLGLFNNFVHSLLKVAINYCIFNPMMLFLWMYFYVIIVKIPEKPVSFLKNPWFYSLWTFC